MSLLSGLYGHATQIRRSYYRHAPARRRRLARPVVSVGNLTVGGSGKTPAVAALARLLLARGERPAILSR
ncbi:MAG: tetraacyldisaccharide 4'-kinase, partial [Acidobacteria bacterium]|nr:tetraacyldisaccharide 4'-kinase [Acidobacteriota bacterium]